MMANVARSLAAAAVVAVLSGCSSAPQPMPEGSGRGILEAPKQAPQGVQSWPRPTWKVGDQFTLVRGQQLRGTFAVSAIEDGNYIIDMGTGRLLHRDADLGNLGQWLTETGEAERVMSPVDTRYHWPLWVGKTWQCEFVDRVRDGKAVTMQAGYLVEAMDRIEVPAGTFDALRIRRTLRLAGEEGDKFLTRTQMIWYAPEPGLEVRQLLGDTLVELVAFERDA